MKAPIYYIIRDVVDYVDKSMSISRKENREKVDLEYAQAGKAIVARDALACARQRDWEGNDRGLWDSRGKAISSGWVSTSAVSTMIRRIKSYST